MGTEATSLVVHPEGEPPEVEAWSAIADTYAGRVHVEWDAAATVTPFGQLPFFIEFLKQGGLFDGWVADCPLYYTSPYATTTTWRSYPVNPPLLGMNQMVSEDAVRRGFDKIDERAGLDWLQGHLD